MEPSSTAAVLLLFGTTLGPAPAVAHTTAATPVSKVTAAKSTGAFARLSPGSQKVALALFNAQAPTRPGSKRMTLEQIAAMRRSGHSWTRVFQHMKSEGLIQERSLAQVVTGGDRPLGAAAVPVTAVPRAYPKPRPAHAPDGSAPPETGYSASYGTDRADTHAVRGAH